MGYSSHQHLVLEPRMLREGRVFTHQDEAGVVSVPPAEGRHTDFWVLVVMENLASAVGVSAQDETRLKPLQQLRRENSIQIRGRLLLHYITTDVSILELLDCI